MKKCGYCGRGIKTDQEFCCMECENNYKRQIQSDRRKIKYFIPGMMIGFAVMLYGILAGKGAMTGTGIGIMQAGNAEFEAEVIKVSGNSLLIEPSDGEEELRCADQISLSADDLGDLDLKEGDVIRVAYNGEILESYPARPGEVYSVESVTE